MAPGCVDIIAAVYSLVLLCKQRTGNTYTVCLQEKQNSKLLVIANIGGYYQELGNRMVIHSGRRSIDNKPHEVYYLR